MRGPQQIATPGRRHDPSRLSCLLDRNQDQARPAEAHTHSAAHRDPHCAWCATRCLQYAGRANVTTSICRAAKVTFLGKFLHKPASHSPVMGPCGLQQQGPWPTDAQGGPPRRRFSLPLFCRQWSQVRTFASRTP